MHYNTNLLLTVVCLLSVNSAHVRPVRDTTLPPDQENTDITNVCSRFQKKNDVIANMLKQFANMDEVILYPKPDAEEPYRYTLTVCSSLGTVANVKNCAIRQDKLYQNEYKDERCLGTTDAMQIAPGDQQEAYVDWAEIWFFNGSSYTSHCGKLKRSARIVFVCDKNQGTSVKYQFIEEDREDVELCSYLFIAETGLVCVPEAYSVNGFWIFVIILLVLLILAIMILLVGISIKRFGMGAKGWEQIPLIGIWRFFGNFLADGCDFFCRCGGRNPTMPSYLQTNVTKDKFGVESSDDDTDNPKEDEHILPL
ncbi:Cation-dependent mannose-6-phosphate receptor [Oopsacas minuta]|uniref:Cation-dependent mannose-6-phosphate receptor n=1 Tax=Oopsacas minuta TaxID=111878 RepID=A0AAV7JXR4_9METZ|nr:Cation-dependent mannose-6-phosphate receptor [Oopsacas minuta]